MRSMPQSIIWTQQQLDENTINGYYCTQFKIEMQHLELYSVAKTMLIKVQKYSIIFTFIDVLHEISMHLGSEYY